MQIDNKKSTYNIWLQKFAATVVLSPLIVVASFGKFFNNPFLGFERIYWILLFVLLYVFVILYHRFRNPYFVFYSDHGDKIILRYYPIRAFNKKKNSIVIPKNRFIRYEIKGSGLSERISVYALFKNEVAKYPEIPLNALPKSDRIKMYRSLDQYVKK